MKSRVGVTVALATLGIACSKQGVPEPVATPALLDAIPADTPYLFATVDPIPGALLQSFARRATPMMKALTDLSQSAAPASSPQERAFILLAAEMQQLMTADGGRAAGLPRDLAFSIHGHGLLPVWRLAVADRARFEAFVDRVLKKAKIRHTTGELSGRRAWHVNVPSGWTLSLVALPNLAAATVLPTGTSPAELRRALIDPPARQLDAAGSLRKLAAEHSWRGFGVGWLDTLRLAQLGADKLRADPICRAELAGLARAMPRVLIGYDQFTEKKIGAEAIVELRRDLAAELASIQTTTAMGGPSDKALFDMAASADVSKGLVFLRRRGQAIAATPYRCAWLEGLNNLGGGLADLEVPPFIEGVRGVRAIVEEFNMQRFSIEGALILRGRDPLAIARALAEKTGGDLSSLRDGGPPVPIPFGFLSPDPMIAVKGEMMAIALGSESAPRVASLLTPAANGSSPLLRISYDYSRLMKIMFSIVPAEKLADMQTAFAGFGRLDYEVRVDGTGLAMRTNMELH